MKNNALLLLVLSVALVSRAAEPAPVASGSYRLDLEANAAAPFPFLSKFGTVKIAAWPGGVRAETVWLNAFSKTGSPTLTVMNPFARMYTDIPLRDIGSIVRKLKGDESSLVPDASFPMDPAVLPGTVRGIPATRHRMILGDSFIDIWVTKAIPRNPQLEAIEHSFIRSISPGVADAVRKLPGTPIFVELNTRRFKKVTVLKLIAIQRPGEGEKEALQTGSFFMRAPLLEALWK
ncbi:MAG TPA: hypothetical protein VNM92_03120 [Thermoanaerobaculia bacterium]|nr:hypothetical protein [Thermoanaerobaculia bacterium]